MSWAWVGPADGEVLRLGTPGSGLGWYCGDGPGPSLRGIMRGALGALSGLGVFTKCALKLYNWPGPARLKSEGLVLDSRVEVPEHMRFYMMFFPGPREFADALYKIGESEIGYGCVRIARWLIPHWSCPTPASLLDTRPSGPYSRTPHLPLTLVLADSGGR